METRKTRTWAEISLGALRNNVRELRRALPEDCILMGVVKADGYGHGAVQVSRVLHEEGCGYLAVACPEEAAALRDAGESLPILILGATNAAYAPMLAEMNVAQTVECAEKGRALSKSLRPGQKLRVHIKLDTGMGRLGFRATDEDALWEAVEVMSLPGLEPEGVFTHFAVSDTPDGEEFTADQVENFITAVQFIEEASGKRFKLHHCANSGAVAAYREDGICFDMARPGLMTYGIAPTEEKNGIALIPAMTLKSRVAAVTHHMKGDTVSYGRTWTAQRDCTIAVLPIGYADGLQRCLSGKLEVLLRGVRVQQVGRICMDLCMVDVTDVPEVQPGDVATIFGTGQDGAPTAAELADWADTIPYEILCAVSPRVPRIYTE